jgi:competence CoiA-like predicted nuclease
MKAKRTIERVLDKKNGQYLSASKIFSLPLQEIERLRSELSKSIEGIQDPIYVCWNCHQLVRIRGGTKRKNTTKTDIFHFAHLKDSDFCEIKTNYKYNKDEVERIKYNGSKESVLHLALKNQIASYLSNTKYVSNLKVESIIKDKSDLKKWRKPDISFEFKNHRIAVELQLSTTWLNVITQRQDFYKEQGMYVLWIFHQFNTDDDDRRLTYDDVIFTNRQNAYVFDKEAQEKSKSQNQLILNCFYRNYSIEENSLMYEWKNEIINTSKLNFDSNLFKTYYYDSDFEEETAKTLIRDRERKLRIKRLERIQLQQEEERKREDNRRKEIERIKNIKTEISFKEEDIQGVNRKLNNLKSEKFRLLNRLNKIAETIENIDKAIEDLINSKINTITDLELVNQDINIKLQNLKSLIEKERDFLHKATELQSKIVAIEELDSFGTFKVLDPKNDRDWAFISSNFADIVLLEADTRHTMFPELSKISSNYQQNRLRESTQFLIMYDFTEILNFRKLEKKSLDNEITQFSQMIVKEMKSLKKFVLTKANLLHSRTNSDIRNLDVNVSSCNNKLETLQNDLSDLKEEL